MDDLTKKKIGKRINSALGVTNVKQKELAEKLGVPDNTVSYWCSGSRTPNTEQIIAISKILSVSSDYLLGLTEAQTTDTTIKAICDYTGLNESAVSIFREMLIDDSKQMEIANSFISDAYFHTLLLRLEFLQDIGCRIAELSQNKIVFAYWENGKVQYYDEDDYTFAYDFIDELQERFSLWEMQKGLAYSDFFRYIDCFSEYDKITNIQKSFDELQKKIQEENKNCTEDQIQQALSEAIKNWQAPQ